MIPVGVTATCIPSRSVTLYNLAFGFRFFSEIAHNSASGPGANGYQQEGLLVPKARFSTILRHTNIATNKVARLG